MTRLALLVLPLLAAAPAAGAAQPRMVVDAAEIDAGAVAQGEQVEGVFLVRNAGDAELAILSAKPG